MVGVTFVRSVFQTFMCIQQDSGSTSQDSVMTLIALSPDLEVIGESIGSRSADSEITGDITLLVCNEVS